MDRKYLWIGLVVVLVGAAAISLVALPNRQEWTTSSPAALEEFELAIDARMKLYHTDARAHLERALELDPDFVFAKLLLADMLEWYEPDRAKALFNDVLSADLDRLQQRERFFIQLAEARHEKRMADAARLIDEYYSKHPDDPWVIESIANQAFYRGESETAERLFRRLLEVAPNWVVAYNQLGYITMAQGRFAEAEEYFTSYRFIAPDQANPHDSLGDLYMIQGRYDDAETSVVRAIEIRPDFWAAHMHLVHARLLRNDVAGAWDAIESWQGVEDAMVREVAAWRCVIETVDLDLDQSWGELLANADSKCVEKAYPAGYVPAATHRAACEMGDWETAAAFEARLEKQLEKAKDKGAEKSMSEAWPTLLHMQGVRLALQGDLENAEMKFRNADAQLTYRESVPGMFKLRNRLLLVETLFAQGRDAEAHKLLAKVRSVNPAIVGEFEENGLKSLGLERG